VFTQPLENWKVMQDVHDMGEKLELFSPQWDSTFIGAQISEWEPIDKLKHLQLIFSDSPYFGRELRYFNQAPWWYRNDFTLPDDSENMTWVIRFTAVDYFCRVWINGVLLGEHEGYFAPFEYDISSHLDRKGPNTLVVKVWSPWDDTVLPGMEIGRVLAVERNLIKGMYEHGDTLIQRDVNPVGIWSDVFLIGYETCRIAGVPRIMTDLDDGMKSARIKALVIVESPAEATGIEIELSLTSVMNGRKVASQCIKSDLRPSKNEIMLEVEIENPLLWNLWDRGRPDLYRADFTIKKGDAILDKISERFGVRKVSLERGKEKTRFSINGEEVFIRGTTYLPDVYLSAVAKEQYIKDLMNIKALGFNAVRVHVNVQKKEFYDLCDEMGLAVIQDSDVNWVCPTTPEFAERAVSIFTDMVLMLYNHPSIITWICLNEPDVWRTFISAAPGDSHKSMTDDYPGPQLVEAVRRLDPSRPYIKGSYCNEDPESGDSHNYVGSLYGEETHYTDILGMEKEKFNTEFGFDAPGCRENLSRHPKIENRLKPVLDRVEELQYYQYRLIKFYMEHYRANRFSPTSGYFHFMFIDLSPQSFYGIYDWWGYPKTALKACFESNMPLAVLLVLNSDRLTVKVVNDTPTLYRDCTCRVFLTGEMGEDIFSESIRMDVKPDSLATVLEKEVALKGDMKFSAKLVLSGQDGKTIAENSYDSFAHSAHPKGHYIRMSHELGMRLFWA
jgi:beta-mannosidase